ncbi:MAG: glycosyltransferase [Allomuricauda sp.]|nr:MAG: glycosyltransferase [Allomuricauda sp.]
MRKVLYVSSVCSEEVLKFIFTTAKVKPQLAAQKFHRLLAEGFAQNHGDCDIKTLSTIPVVPANHSKKIWKLPQQKVKKVKYNYIPMVNIRGVKNLGIFIYTFLYVFFWSLFATKKKSVVCDLLNVTVSIASMVACKLTGVKIVAIVTDLPGLMVDAKKSRNEPNTPIVTKRLTWFDGYIILTEQMNQIINPNNKPYMVMEGLVDSHMQKSSNELKNKYPNKTILYAGGLFEKYGLKTLIEAFKLVKDPSYQLHLYGLGEMVENMADYIADDKRIKYLGVVPNEKVVAEQIKVSLLVNPRPTQEEFTKYSFPSKNMEYMVSGTPIVTTKLPGMPAEYNNYVYLFDDESIQGMSGKIGEVLEKSAKELHDFGSDSKSFVLKKKNNSVQAKRILNFLDNAF